MRLARSLLVASLAGVPLSVLSGRPPEPTLRLSPDRIEMTSFYSGAALRVEGTVAKGSGVVVVISGAAKNEKFNKKARFGAVWANAGTVQISGTPSLLLRFSSKPIHALLRPEAIRQRQLDEDSLKATMRFEPVQDAHVAAGLRSDYLTLKREDGLYQVSPEAVAVQDRGDAASFSLEFPWPKKAPPAHYAVRLLECRNGEVAGESLLRFEVVKTGFPARMAMLANEHAPAYGLLAVLIAAAAGFSIDYVVSRLFGKKSRAAH